jgi:hypothetical protein
MTNQHIKIAIFLAGTLLVAAATVPAFAAAAAYLAPLGTLLLGWSGLQRPGDVSP